MRRRRFLIAGLGLLVAGLALSLAAGEMLTRPARAHVGPPPPGLQAESLRIPYGDGQHLAGWFLPGRSGQGAVLLQHGVRGNRLQMLARARWLQREGIASLTVDLPAHGESSGERITFGRHEARGTEAAMAWLRTRLPGEKVGAIGVSLGGASLLFAQRQPELDALVLESVYPTIVDAVQDRLAMRLGTAGAWVAPLLLVQLPLRLGIDAEQLRPIDAVAGVRAPLLIASGTLDLHTRWPETERLFAAAVEPKALWPVQGAAHVDLHGFDPAAYEARLLPWLQSHLRKSPP
ncbi:MULTISPECIES: alpha/beta hydrolase [unclassified Roseateles]|uniref:alpha/beta hydrolase n=1 Tax=unclassified Roseateles TaxID=2626991 RepID=UPI00070228A4|nr:MULTISPECIES: alpha/beta hydrolase [unclassified Roseateles]KQW41135.1 esterase [Pelomonas sp. Root405]KRA67907.1 esterase [Pelomonas sp. Root662]